jgi:hypothetical protein
MKFHHTKCIRRNATAVMVGTFDIRPPRDVLTSLLNGVGLYKAVERDEEERHKRKKEKREREKERKRAARALHKALLGSDSNQHAPTDGNFASTSSLPQPLPTPRASTSSFWRARPTIHIPAIQRSVSVTPSPTSSPRPYFTPGSTPGPSISSSISRSSSKRPRTPEDDEVIGSQSSRNQSASLSAPPRKKRVAVKKGWKGWVEGSPPPSEKLINLDAPVLQQQRRTRSGKNFDAIGVGKESWVDLA